MHTHAISAAVPQPLTVSRHRPRAEVRATRALQEDYARLLSGIDRIKTDLYAAQINFDYVCDPKAVDVCIYQIQTAQSQYENLLNELKALNRRIKTPEELSV